MDQFGVENKLIGKRPAEPRGQLAELSLSSGEPGPDYSGSENPPTTVTPAMDTETSIPDQNLAFQDLRRRWNQLGATVDSLSGTLISASDLRRSILEKRRSTLERLNELLASQEDSTLQALQTSLLDLQNDEWRLQEMDEKAIEQGYEVLTQGPKIFGPASESSFKILDSQDVAIQSEDTDTEAATDDIRLDQNPEAQASLSKKGDVDLLRERFAELEADRILTSKNQDHAKEASESLETIEQACKEVIQKLERAEKELSQLRDNLPDRRVSVPADQLRAPEEEDDDDTQAPFEHDRNNPTADCHQETLQAILQSTTEGPTVTRNTLVKAWLSIS